MLQKRQLTASGISMLAVFTTVLAFGQPARAQNNTSTMTGEVVSSSSHTLTVRSNSGQYQLFTYAPGANRPATLTNGTRVTVVYSAGDEAGVSIASSVTAANASNAGQAAETAPVVPQEVRRLERDIERDARRFRVGVRAGVALDPELILIGVQSQIGPFFSSNVYFRPNVEFGWGEVTAMFSLNPEVIYRLPVTSRAGRWSTYVGAGPGFNFVHQDFGATSGSGKRVDFSDFHSDVGLNILGGIRYRSGMFTELKTSVYASSSPTLRIIVGYNF
jgi:hypothetical protein